MPELANYRRERFSRFYLVFMGNQTKSAAAAGYSPRTAHLTGHRLMQDDKVKLRIQELKDLAFDSSEITLEFLERALLAEALDPTAASRDRKAALDSIIRMRGGFTDNVNQGAPENMAEVLKALQEVLPKDQLAKLAKQFGVDIAILADPLPEPTAPGTETQQ